MAFRKKYTDKQYREFFHTPFNSSFGISNPEQKLARYWSNHRGYVSQFYNLSYSMIKNYYIPYLKKQLGGHGYIMFGLIASVEGGSPGTNLGFINHTYRTGQSWKTAMYNDCVYIKSLINHAQYSVANSDVYGGIGYMPQSATSKAREVLKTCKKGDIGRYYIPATMAGNAWTFAHSWSMSHMMRYGNPYDQIIDAIKQLGGKPFAGYSGGGSSGGDKGTGLENINLPKAVYLNNSEFSILGVHFRRYRNWLFIKYPLNFSSGSSGSSGSGSSGGEDAGAGSNKSKIEKELKIYRYLSGRSYRYVNGRPQPNPRAVGWADCSGMVGYIMHTAYPRIWNGGYINTGTMLAYARAHNMVVWHGSQTQLVKNMSKVHTGDFIVMGGDPSCGAGLQSHVVFCYSGSGAKAKICSMEGNGWLKHSLSYFLRRWWTYKPYMYVCRSK